MEKAKHRLQIVLFRGKQSHAPGRGLADLLRQQVRFLMGEGDQARSLEKRSSTAYPACLQARACRRRAWGLQIVTGDEEYGFFLWCCRYDKPFTLKI